MVRPRPLSVLMVACAALGAGGLGACDLVLGIEPWSAEPGEGEGGAASSSSAAGGAGGATRSSSAAEGGTACDETVCDGACVDVAVDPRHCGVCGHSCFAEGGCVDGVCGVVELAKETSARYVAATDGHVAWTVGQTALRSIDKATLAAGPPVDGVQVSELAGSAALLYYAEPTDGLGNGRIQVLDLAGSAVPRVICNGPRARASSLRADGNTVFLAPGGSSAENGVYRCSSGGSGGDPSPVCIANANTNPAQLALVDTFVVARSNGNALVLCSKDGAGGSPSTLAGLTGSAVGGTASHLYFADSSASPSPLMRRAATTIASFDSEELVLQTGLYVIELHATSTHLAWRDGDRVQAALLAAPTALLLDELGPNIVDVALDDDGVYWVQTDGTVKAFAFPP